jgi:hypothetical protein
MELCLLIGILGGGFLGILLLAFTARVYQRVDHD